MVVDNRNEPTRTPKRRGRPSKHEAPQPKSRISKEQALIAYRRRSTELRFNLPDVQLRKIIDVAFSSDEKCEAEKFDMLLEAAFRMKMSEEDKDKVPLEFLRLLPVAHYSEMIAAVIILKEEGGVDHEVADGIIAAASKDLVRANRLKNERAADFALLSSRPAGPAGADRAVPAAPPDLDPTKEATATEKALPRRVRTKPLRHEKRAARRGD